MDHQVQEKRVVSRRETPTGEIVEETVTSATPVDTSAAKADTYEFTIAKLSNVVWAIVGIINLLILLRFVFLLLAANNTGIVSFIYSFTNIFVAPFSGIFESVRYGQSFFDTASILAVLMYLVIGVVINTIIKLFSVKDTA